MTTVERSSPIESVDRALRLLILMRDEGPISVTEAAGFLGTSVSTAHRLLSAMVYRGVAEQGEHKKYGVDVRFSKRDVKPFSTRLLWEQAAGPMNRLLSRVQETVHLMLLKGPEIEFVDGFEPRAALKVGVRAGERMPAYVSSGGKAMLSRLSGPEIDAVYPEGLPRWTEQGTKTLRLLKRELADVRRSGFAVNIEETERGVCGVGISINDVEGRPVGAITVALPSTRFRRVDIGSYAMALQHTGAEVERNVAVSSR